MTCTPCRSIERKRNGGPSDNGRSDSGHPAGCAESHTDATGTVRSTEAMGGIRRRGYAYFHSQSLLLVFPSASASYSKTMATVFSRLNFVESL